MKLEYIPTNQIDFGDRARKNYDNIGAFSKDIEKRGMISPIAVRDFGENIRIQMPRYKLLAGGRRLRAAELLKMPAVPAHIYDHELTEFEMKAIELSENLNRESLTWAEDVLLKKEIHDLLIETHGEKLSRDPDAPGWSQQQTAQMLGVSPANLSRDLKLAKTLIVVPELGTIKTKDEAGKLAKKVGSDIIKGEKAAVIIKKQADTGVATVRQGLVDNYIILPEREDPFESGFFEGVTKLKPNMIDLVEIDPPYAINYPESKKVNVKSAKIATHGYNEIDAGIYPEWLAKVVSECYRVMKEGSWIIIWYANHPWFNVVAKIISSAGFDFMALPAIWTKPAGQTQQPKLYLGSTYESFFYARKGAAKISKEGRSNNFSFKPVSPALKTHPTERPIELMQEILNTFGKPGDRVLVPFLGSGNTILAAVNLQMNAFGYELTEEYKNDFIIKVHGGSPPNYRSYIK